jgi:hypothetical protein
MNAPGDPVSAVRPGLAHEVAQLLDGPGAEAERVGAREKSPAPLGGLPQAGRDAKNMSRYLCEDI